MGFIRSIPQALRTLSRAPGFTATLVLVLSFGIAINTTIFTVLDQVLLNPFPYREPDRLALIWESNPHLGQLAANRAPVAWANFESWKNQNHSFDSVEALQIPFGFNLTGVPIPEYLTAARATPGFFPMLGINAALGRTFLPDDAIPGAAPAVLLTRSFAIKRFGNSSPLGQRLLLNGTPYTIAGVLPKDFHLPATSEGINEYKPDIWVPLPAPSSTDPAETLKRRRLLVFARLKPGVTLLQAQTDMTAIAEHRAKDDPALNTGYGVNVFSLFTENTDPDLRRALNILLLAAFILLLLACTNLTGLVLTRATARRRDLAIRAALGASRRALLTPLLAETFLLCILASLLSLFLTYAGIRLTAVFKPSSIFAPERLTINLHSFLFTASISLLVLFIVGLLPAFFTVRADLTPAIKSAPLGQFRPARRSLSRLILISFEIAAALGLTITATLLVKSFQQLLKIDPGFRPQNVLTAHLSLAPQHYATPQERVTFCRQLLHKLHSLPGIESAALVDNMPLYAIRYTQLEIEGRPLAQINAAPTADYAHLTPDFLQIMGVQLRRGRNFTDQDAENNPAVVAIINETLAHQLWPNQDPVGTQIRELLPNRPPGPWQTVVGVVHDFAQFNVDTPARPEVFWPTKDFREMTVILRTAQTNPANLSLTLQHAIASLDHDQPVTDIQTLQEMIDYGIGQYRFNMLLLGAFALSSIVLTLIAVYGQISALISAQTREIGIRFALGASRNRVCVSLLRPVMFPLFAGIPLGLLSSFFAKQLITTLLFQTSPLDALTFIAAPAVLLAIFMLTSLAATRRTARIEPAAVLRQE